MSTSLQLAWQVRNLHTRSCFIFSLFLPLCQRNHFPKSAYAFASNHASGNAPLTAVQLLWVNMIMDTLGALALATEPPNDDLMKRSPVGRKGNFISNVMWRNILGQSVYQFVVIWLLQTRGKSVFRLEGPDSDLILNTLIFNTFVFCQVTFLKDLQAPLVEHYVWSGIMWYILTGRWWQAGLVILGCCLLMPMYVRVDFSWTKIMSSICCRDESRSLTIFGVLIHFLKSQPLCSK